MRAQKLYCITFAYEWQIRNEGEPNVFRFVTSFQSSRIASSAATASAPRSPDGSGFHLHLHYIHANTAHTTHKHSYTYSTHNCICVCAYLRLCKTRSDMYTIVLPFQLYTNTNKKWEWYTIATSAVCARLYAGVCMCVPEHSPVLASPKTQWQTK